MSLFLFDDIVFSDVPDDRPHMKQVQFEVDPPIVHLSWKPYFGPNFWHLKDPNLWSNSNNINSDQKPLNEIRMFDIWQIVSVDV